MPEFSSVTDAIQVLTGQWPHLQVVRTEDHVAVKDGDETLYDGPDWGLLFFVDALRGAVPDDRQEAPDKVSRRSGAAPTPGDWKPT